MSKKTLSWLLLVSFVINLAVLATYSYYRWLQSPASGFKRSRSNYRELMYKRLKVTDEQRAQMDTLHSRFIKRNKPIWRKIRELRGQMSIMLDKDSVALDSIKQKVDSLKSLEKIVEMESVKNLMRYRSVLSPEQYKTLMKMIFGRYQGEKESQKATSSKKNNDCNEKSVSQSNNRQRGDDKLNLQKR